MRDQLLLTGFVIFRYPSLVVHSRALQNASTINTVFRKYREFKRSIASSLDVYAKRSVSEELFFQFIRRIVSADDRWREEHNCANWNWRCLRASDKCVVSVSRLEMAIVLELVTFNRSN